MARRAVRAADVVADVAPQEARPLRRVAVDAQRGNHLGQERGGLGRRMGRVTAQAALLDRRVLVRGTRDRLGQIGVAVEAQRVPRKSQLVLVLRGVRIVALHALAFDDRAVCARSAGRHHRCVAGGADRALRGREQLAVVRGVRIVAVGAVPGLDRRVNVRQGDLLLEVHVTRETQLARRAGLQPVVGRALRPEWRGHGHGGERGHDPRPACHGFAPGTTWHSSHDRPANGA